MSPIEILRSARDTLSKGWAKTTLARKSDGNRCDLDDPEADCFCLSGALMRCVPFLGGLGYDGYYEKYPELATAVDAIVEIIPDKNDTPMWIIAGYNDSFPGKYVNPTAPAEMLSLLDRAITNLEEP